MGRTGVFLTVMAETERVKLEADVDILQTVKSIRVQRPNMVSTVVSNYTHAISINMYKINHI